jgi:hypothetical protein
LILTAAHVVLDETGHIDETISVTLPSGEIKAASELLPVDANMFLRDYALLRIEGTASKLPHFGLGDLGLLASDTEIGSDITIIGFPLSAGAFKSNAPSLKEKFCLSGSIAYFGNTNVSGMVNTPKGPSAIQVGVDVVYFQGPSIKGLSGSPVISNASGDVIAILTTRLTGISETLAQQRESLKTPAVEMGGNGFSLDTTLTGLIDVMDTQLANGLGAGTGIEDAKAAMRHILRQRRSQQQQNGGK